MNVADLNPQAREMADLSMVRNLAWQAQAIWPQERPVIESYGLPRTARILDLACGTGEITDRLADLFPGAQLLGVDVDPLHVERARTRCARHGAQVKFQIGNAYELGLAQASFDFALCRHLFQAVPEPGRIVEQLHHVLNHGGRVHVIAEDYSLMLFHPVKTDTDRFFQDGPMTFGQRTGTDLRIGRKTPALLIEAGFKDVRCEYLVVDTLRVPRETFAGIWEAWRDGYSATIARHSRLSEAEIAAAWSDMLAAIRDPSGYAVWLVPCVSGIKI